MDGFEYYILDEKSIGHPSINSSDFEGLEKITDKQPREPDTSDYFVSIATHSTSYCVGIVVRGRFCSS